MAERSGPSRILALVLVGLGAFLLVAAILIPTYTVPRLEKTPLDLEVTTVSTGTGSVLNAASLAAGRAQVDENVNLVSQRFVTTEEPSNADDITVQAGQTLRRTDKQGDTGLLTASVDRVTLDRVSSEPVENPVGTIQVQGDKPAEEVPHTGLQYKFPFNAEQKAYPFFDINARASQDIDFVEETEINGTPVYKYEQTVGPVDLSGVVNLPTNKVTLPADTWGVEGGEAPVTMTRWYENTRTVWVEPKTGVIVDGEEQIHQYYSRTAGQPEVDVLNAPIKFDENTVEYQIQRAKDGQDQLSTFGRTVPIIAGILGVIALIAGIVLGLRGGNGPRRPVRTGGPQQGGGGGAAPAAPQNRDWTTDQTEVIPRTNLSKE
ncbi:MAG: DUF3068 domain-containing protein [Rhodococcus fascians]|uniref:DUF3068 domain-containing protein n=1 Tax=Nocardiaceae TaxID=85025 RepID=UPI000381D7BA|nr:MULTISPECIES: DUF3068 domain-containing protein [Rhodococcus]OZC78307.1 DUF3068 domain-containing protein [Rhodococcus sp. 06-418-1B]OZD17650.1 DUF3068 domain-containing protein [Rhodococcus sp. 06-156-4C]OZD20316.1 DUF3068 domain-containing protein [Rhodococcus sp. 06-156-3C]OZD21550.1 DUF3068 domain-containing protein [Rhodococcus sp. 06-156-4a]OZD33246.1 DUF3068 domain-containing protein [Rhodococcus sp. 06-156-3b]